MTDSIPLRGESAQRACRYLALVVLAMHGLIAATLVRAAVPAAAPTQEEIAEKDAWVHANLFDAKAEPPFSFMLESGAPSDFFRAWPREESTRKIDADRTEHTFTWRDAATGLEVRCVVVYYSDYPVVEWTVYLKNTGAKRTPLMKNIEGLDIVVNRKAEGEFTLHGIKGDYCVAESYEPFALPMPAGFQKTFGTPIWSGKSCDGPDGWPYQNLHMPGGGMIFAYGWPGAWHANFTREGERGLRVAAGQQSTHLVLEPGEEIRTPLIAVLFYNGDDIVRSQNLWRRWNRAHVIPKVDGKELGPLAHVQVDGVDKTYLQGLLDAGAHIDLAWRDAGAGGPNTWYPSDKGPYAPKPGEPPTDQWLNTGTWDVDTRRYPDGFRPFSDWCHSLGLQFFLWFEVERAGSPETFLGSKKEWLLPQTPSTVGSIVNEGNPECREWLTNHVDELIKTQGLDWYREDMNGDGPYTAWRLADAGDRQGMTENLYIQGHLKYWDDLVARNPGLRIDSCASGGRRNDLETMRRAVPFVRSDYQFPDRQEGVFESNQCQTLGLSSWLPYVGSGTYRYTPYEMRSFYLPVFGTGCLTWDNKEEIKEHAEGYKECARVAPAMVFGDYYPLTPYSLAKDVWLAWQFDRPELGEGAIQAFRREASKEGTIHLKLHGLEPDASYEMTDFDHGVSTHTGRELMEQGLEVTLDPHASAVFTYKLKAAGS
jgi:alpha-galactosidase